MPMAWQPLLPVTQSQWFKVDLGRVLLVNAISIQGDPRRGESFYSDYKIQYNLNDIAVASSLVTIKEEDTSSERVREILILNVLIYIKTRTTRSG